MKQETRQDLLNAYEQCKEGGRSTEYTLQFLQDVCHVSLETVIVFLESL